MTGRLPHLAPDELSDEQRALYDAIVAGPRSTGPQLFALADAAGRLNGPFNALLFSPPVGTALAALGEAVRYGSVLTARVREAAVLAVAAHEDSDFERYAHEPLARAAGLSDQDLVALRDGQLPSAADPAGDPVEGAAARAVRALLVRGDLDDEEHGAALAALGARGLVELTTLVGYYRVLALQLRVFRVARPGPAATGPGAERSP